jgi:8-oxo-dGTP diphosphatase
VTRTTVVGAALVRDGRVLAARRTASASVPGGGWEFPGGKVERGESPESAVAREVVEELGCDVEVTGWLAGESEVRPGLVLRVALARLVGGEPIPSEHDIVWWLPGDRLGEVTWLPADLPFLAELTDRLSREEFRGA